MRKLDEPPHVAPNERRIAVPRSWWKQDFARFAKHKQ